MKIVYLVPGGPEIHALLRASLPAPLALATPDPSLRAEVVRELADASCAIASHFDAGLISAAPHLRLIQLPGVGYDAVDVATATRARIPVAQAFDGTIDETAEHTLLLMLAVYRKLPALDASVRRGEWPFWELKMESRTLKGRRVGIVGFGRIGREVAHRCAAFGVDLAFHDIAGVDPAVAAGLNSRAMPLDDLCAWADILTLHVPLSPATRGLIGAARLALMRPSAILINAARGPIVDEAALVRALAERRIAGAGLDVFDHEPPGPGHALYALENTVLTPHAATGTRDSTVDKFLVGCANLLRILRGEPPANVINPEALAGPSIVL